MKLNRGISGWIVSLVWVTAAACPLRAGEPLEQLISSAKREGELVFIAGAETFGGKRAFSALEAAFNKKYGVKGRITFTAGPSMAAMAARVITELKTGRKSSTDLSLGSQSHFALFHKENALEPVDWSGIFPWITKEMEILRNESVLVYTSLNGVLYNSDLIPKEKAPKRYEDLVDPRLSPTWAGKLAIQPNAYWLVELSSIWGKEKVRDFTRKLVALSGGRLRPNEAAERVASGEFPIMANVGSSLETMWEWQAKGAPLVGVPGSTPPITSFYQLAVPRNSAHPNLAKLFVAFMASKEAQAIVEKFEFRSSHLVEGTRMAKYLSERRLKLQDVREAMDLWLRDDKGSLEIQEELTKLLKK